MERESYFITAIDTNVGKTVVSTIFARALNYSYWKPIQAGDLDDSDSIKVKKFLSEGVVYPEGYRLTSPMSPHAAANIDGVSIDLNDFQLPQENELIVEGAGGIMVPINNEGDCILDIIKKFKLKTVIAFRNYLGSINHTIMTIERLQSEGVEILGLVRVGGAYQSSEEIICNKTGVNILFDIPLVDEIDEYFIENQALRLREQLK